MCMTAARRFEPLILDYAEFEDLMDEVQHRFSMANIDGTLS